MSPLSLAHAALTAVLAVGIGICNAVAAGRPLEAADIMRMESIGQVAVADRTGSIAYTRLRPYESATHFVIASPFGAWDRADVFLWRKGDKAPRLLDLPQHGQRSYNLGDGHSSEGSFSPDGSRLLVFWNEEDRIRFGVYDLRAGKLLEMQSPPELASWKSKPVWVDNDEIVYASTDDEWNSFAVRGRAIVAAHTTGLWKEAFRGKVLTAEEVRSYKNPADSIQYDDGRLVLVNVATGAERTLGRGQFSAINASPDGRLIAVLRHSRSHQFPAGQNANQMQGAKHTLRIYSREGDERTICDDCNVVYNLSGPLSWSSDSRYLSFFARSFDEPMEAGRYYRLRLEDFELRPYAHPDVQVVSMAESVGMFAFPTPATQVGADIAIYGRTRQTGEPTVSRVNAPYPGRRGRADWYLVSIDGGVKNLTAGLEGVAPSVVYADRASFVVSAGGELWSLSGTRPARNLTADISEPVAPAGAAMWSRNLKLMAIGAARRALSFDVISRSYAAVEFPSATAELRGITREGAALFVDATTTGTSLEIRGPDATVFADSFNSHRREIDAPRWQPLSYTYKGKQVTSCALLPNDYVAGRRYAAVFYVYTGRDHTGPAGVCPPAGTPHIFQREWSGDITFLATRGYVIVNVASPDDLVFEDGNAMKGLGGTADAALDAATRAGFVDPERAGVFGTSGGGISALQIATQSNRFRAASAQHTFANAISAWGEASPWTRYFVDNARMGFGPAHGWEQDGSILDLNGPPWANLEGYIANSPVLNAHKISAAVQLIATDMDAVSDTNLQEMLSALYRLNKEAEMVTYFGENHWLSSPVNWVDAWKRIEAFFDRHLKAPAREIE